MKDAEHPEWMWSTSISELDGKYMFLSVSRDTARVCIPFVSFTSPHANVRTQKNLLWVADLQQNDIGQNMKWEKLIDDFEAEYEV